MTKEQVIQGYLMNSPRVVAEMLYETIERYEDRKCDNCKTKNCSIKRILVEKDEINTDYFNCNDWESK